MKRNVLVVMGLTALLAAAVGCPQGPKKSQLSGKVMFKGQPVPAGYIQFTPDAQAGGRGSVRVAQIKDGMYDTAAASDPGVVPGPTVIRIAGFDGKVIPMFGQGKQIFNAYELKETLVEGVSTKDFTVPDSAADNLKIERTADQ